jgi:hypothetical protein
MITTGSIRSTIPKRVGATTMATRGGRKMSRGGKKKKSRGGRKRR